MENIKKIGIDCRMVKESGIGRYIFNLIVNLSKIDTKNQYYLFYFNFKDLDLELPANFHLISAPIRWHSFSEQSSMLKIINSYNLDLYHSPHPNMPFFYSKKFIITIHDLTMLKEMTGRASTYFFPVYYLKWLVFKIMLSRAVRNSEKIITVSEFVKKEIVSTFNISENKVEVIYNGVPEKIQKKESSEIESVLKKFKITKPYLFYVGNAYPHKNLERLVLAFTLFNLESKYELVLGGKEDFFYKRLTKDSRNLSSLKFLGELTDEEISALYSGCQAFVYPSISEGFGIQIIEAIKCEARVICSNNTSFPEIAGDYAFYFNPLNVEDIKKCLAENINAPYKDKLSKSQNRLDKFSWKLSAQQHYDLFKKI